MKKVLIIITVCWGICLITLLNGISAQRLPESKVVARVGCHVITLQELNELLAQVRATADMRKVLETFTPEGKAKLLEELMDTKLFALEASERKIDQEPQVHREVQRAVDNVLSKALLRKEIDTLDCTDKGLHAFYQDNLGLFMTEMKIKTRHIVTASRQEAEQAMMQIKQGAHFGNIAAMINIDGTRSKSGDLGWIVKGMMVKNFDEALFALKENEISGIVETKFGYHIIKAEKIDRGQPRPFETIKEEVKRQMIEQHVSTLKATLKEKYPIEINRNLLELEYQ
jgi:peptidyl-prolyl cis-trans isomerase C